MFSGLQMLNNRIAPMVHQACSKLMWNVSFPVHFLAWWLSAAARPVSPASDVQRETRAAKWEEDHKLFNPLKGASDGIHASHVRGMKAPPEAYKNKATITTPKTTQQKPTKSILWEKEWGKKCNEISFRSEERNQEGVSEKEKKNTKKSLSSLDNPISRWRHIDIRHIKLYKTSTRHCRFLRV